MTDKPVEPAAQRGIRSYVIRGGRMTVGQARAWDSQWPLWGREPQTRMPDWDSDFNQSGPLVLEIGFGMGQSLAAMAEAAPDTRFIGVEVHRPGVGALLMEIEKRGLTNLRLYCCDANDVMSRCLPDQSLDRIQLYFPDPWHKKKHNKRRLVQPDWLRQAARKLKTGGLFHMATDWTPYAEHAVEAFAEVAGFRNLASAGDYVEQPDWRPNTKFEARGERLGHEVHDLLYEWQGD